MKFIPIFLLISSNKNITVFSFNVSLSSLSKKLILRGFSYRKLF